MESRYRTGHGTKLSKKSIHLLSVSDTLLFSLRLYSDSTGLEPSWMMMLVMGVNSFQPLYATCSGHVRNYFISGIQYLKLSQQYLVVPSVSMAIFGVTPSVVNLSRAQANIVSFCSLLAKSNSIKFIFV